MGLAKGGLLQGQVPAVGHTCSPFLRLPVPPALTQHPLLHSPPYLGSSEAGAHGSRAVPQTKPDKAGSQLSSKLQTRSDALTRLHVIAGGPGRRVRMDRPAGRGHGSDCSGSIRFPETAPSLNHSICLPNQSMSSGSGGLKGAPGALWLA